VVAALTPPELSGTHGFPPMLGLDVGGGVRGNEEGARLNLSCIPRRHPGRAADGAVNVLSQSSGLYLGGRL
jgi:hypothetical protein